MGLMKLTQEKCLAMGIRYSCLLARKKQRLLCYLCRARNKILCGNSYERSYKRIYVSYNTIVTYRFYE